MRAEHRAVEAAPLPADIAAHLAGLPSAGGVLEFRDQVFAGGGTLAHSLRRLEAAHAAGKLPAPVVAEALAWAAFLALVRGLRAVTTVARYVDNLCRFQIWLAEQRVDHTAVDLTTFDAWQKWMALSLRYKAKWRMLQVAAVRNFYDWRCTRGLGENCARDLRSPRDKLGMAKRYTNAQLQGLLSAAAGLEVEAERIRDKALMLFLLATGARREETSLVDLRDLDMGKQTGVVRLHGKGAKERDVPFEGPVVTALLEWLLHRETLGFDVDPDAVFVGLRGPSRGMRMQPGGLERRVRIAARTAKLREWGMHRFRVTYATLMYDDGAGIEEIRRLLGHQSIETTRRYIDVSERARKTRLSSHAQHIALGTKNQGGPRWMQAALGGGQPRD